MALKKANAVKKLNPKQLFVVSQIPRADIAKMLNDSIDAAGATDVDRFKQDDPRLTDKECKYFATLVYDADCQNDEGMAEANMAAADTFIGELPADMRKRPKPRTSSRAKRTGRRR